MRHNLKMLFIITISLLLIFMMCGFTTTKKEFLSDLPEYDGQPYAVINDNNPWFPERGKNTKEYINLVKKDNLNRCGRAVMKVSPDTLATEERGPIGHVKPSGWHTVKYNDIIDGNYLYNRCHLLGYQLSGLNDDERNLITGTRYLNVEGMLPFENKVEEYVRTTGNHVVYRVTPIFEDDNLVASGIIMEAYSVEDDGKGICFNVYCFNVQPGVIIDYKTGNSERDSDYKATRTTDTNTSSSSESSDNSSEAATSNTSSGELNKWGEPLYSPSSDSVTYVLNTSKKKFHRLNCKNIRDMKNKNTGEFFGSREEAINNGYSPCGNCNP